jgi:hypothetical protein
VPRKPVYSVFPEPAIEKAVWDLSTSASWFANISPGRLFFAWPDKARMRRLTNFRLRLRSPLALGSLVQVLLCLIAGAGALAHSFAQSSDLVTNGALRPDTPLETNLRILTDEVGGRVPGTPEFDRAREWAIHAFQQAGADSVATEDFTIPLSWDGREYRCRGCFT